MVTLPNPDEREFYEIETAKSQWNVRQLQRQYDSSLHDALVELTLPKDAHTYAVK